MKLRAASRSAASSNATSRSGAAPSMWSRPEREASAPVLLQSEIDLHALDAGGKRLGGQSGEVGGAEIAAQLVVEVHA